MAYHLFFMEVFPFSPLHLDTKTVFLLCLAWLQSCKNRKSSLQGGVRIFLPAVHPVADRAGELTALEGHLLETSLARDMRKLKGFSLAESNNLIIIFSFLHI